MREFKRFGYLEAFSPALCLLTSAWLAWPVYAITDTVAPTAYPLIETKPLAALVRPTLGWLNVFFLPAVYAVLAAHFLLRRNEVKKGLLSRVFTTTFAPYPIVILSELYFGIEEMYLGYVLAAGIQTVLLYFGLRNLYRTGVINEPNNLKNASAIAGITLMASLLVLLIARGYGYSLWGLL